MSSHAFAPQFESVALPLPPTIVRIHRPVRRPSVFVAPAGSASVGIAQVEPAGVAAARTRPGEISLRRKCVDVLLLSVWGALIPGFMWLGHYAGL